VADGIVERVKGPSGEYIEIVVKAPVAEMKLAALEMNQAPPTDREVAEVAMTLAQEEHDNAQVQANAASQIATVAVALAYCVLHDVDLRARSGGRLGSGSDVRIPRWVIDRVTDARLGVKETADRDVILAWRERGEGRLQPEEMRDA
jgi:hypothetical protein